MAQRRRQNDDWWVGLIIQLTVLIMAVAMFIPGVRPLLLSIGVVAFVLLGLSVGGLIGFSVYQLVTRARRHAKIVPKVRT